MLSFSGRNRMDRPWPCDSAIRIKSFNDATPNIEVDLGAISSLKEIYVHWRFDAKNWTGKNLLGFALMEVRNQLK